MGNKTSKSLENHFTDKEKDILLSKKDELGFLTPQKRFDENELLEECWKSFQFLQISADCDIETFLERIRMPKAVRNYIESQKDGNLKTHPLTKQLLKGFWGNILKNSKLRDFTDVSPNLLSNAEKFILEIEGSLKSPLWKLTFSTLTNGKAWNSFCQSLELSEESVVVIRDKDGKVFGGYKPTPFIASPNFKDEPNSFVFSLKPAKLYKPSGVNNHHTYFNHGSKSGFPNGIGYINVNSRFGGQLEYFGIFLDKDFECGHSRANPISTTFSSPQFSGKEDFLIDEVEVWMIRERDVESIEYKKSVLDGNSEVKALLEMSGRQIYSDGLREPLESIPPK